MTKEEREDAINFFKNKLENEVYWKKFNKLAIEALEQESTTKNDISNKSIIYKAKKSKEIQEDLDKLSELNEPTTKNDLADNKTFHEQIVEYCNEHFLVLVEKDVWEDARKALTTKNNLGVDCISRADARSLICKIDQKHHMTGMSWKAFKDLYNGIDDLPSVTPQEPRKGHWVEEFNDLEGEVRFTCSSCGKYQLFGTDFCYHCGSDNREVEE